MPSKKWFEEWYEERKEKMHKTDKTKEIKKIMKKALESGEWVCHDDIPDFVDGFTDYFTVCGDGDEPSYLVAILRVEI